MKRLIIASLLLCFVLIFTGCEKDSSNSLSLSNETSESLEVSEQMTAEAFNNITELKESISKNKNISDDIPLFDIRLDLENSGLSEITLTGNNIYYRFVLNSFSYYDNDKKDNENEASDDMKEPSSEESKPESDSGEVDNISFINQVKNTISIGWNFTGNGEEGLKHFVSGNSEQVFPVAEHDGLYYSDVADDNGNVIGKVLYWVQDDCFFEMSVSEEYLNLFTDKIQQDKSYIRKIE